MRDKVKVRVLGMLLLCDTKRCRNSYHLHCLDPLWCARGMDRVRVRARVMIALEFCVFVCKALALVYGLGTGLRSEC